MTDLVGTSGDDTLNGGAGQDLLEGGAGHDSLVGDSGTGEDSYLFAPGINAFTGYFTSGTTWTSQDQVPRLVGDVNGDGRADIVGFSSTSVRIALGQADGTFGAALTAYSGSFTSAYGWNSQNINPRQLADVNGDGRMDIVGFANNGVLVALGQANGTFSMAQTAYSGYFGAGNTWTNQNTYPRQVADVNGDGRADIVGFSSTSVMIALGQTDGTFGTIQAAYNGSFTTGYGWSSQNLYPRMLGDVDGDGLADIVAFGENNVVIARGQANGTFAPAMVALSNSFTLNTTWNSQDRHPRQLADVNGDGRADIIGFADAGAYVAFGQADGTFSAVQKGYLGWYGNGNSWNSQNINPRQVADVDGDGRADIIGFSSTYVAVSLATPNDDTLIGGAGNDTLDGGAGIDSMVGGVGNDIYIVDNADDVVSELAGEGADEVRTTLARYTLGDNVEYLTYLGPSNFNGAGNALDNVLTGGNGNDTLNGGAGNDTLIGGAGSDSLIGGADNDIYVVGNGGDVVSELAGGGIDEVHATLAAYTLTANVENLSYIGSGNFNGAGNALDNALAGGNGNDTLSGGGGDDTLIGGAAADNMIGGVGDDVYIVDNAGDVVMELAGEGGDEVRTSLNAYSLSVNFENLTFIGSGAFTGIGNNAANSIQGGTGNDTLDGGDGTDTLRGGAGNDTYLVSDIGDVIVENAGEGADEVRTGLTSYTLAANVENLVYTGMAAFTGTGNTSNNLIIGGAGDDSLIGDAGNDTLDGGVGVDMLVGGAGNDTCIVDDVGDVIVEMASQGVDTVRTSLSSYILAANVENLVYTGSSSGSVTFTGNALNNSMTGGAGADLLTGLDGDDMLNGGVGADTLIGGAGNDAYVVDNADDVLIELPSEGIDTVRSAISHILLADFENLTLTGSAAIAGAGNAADNVLIGNGAANLLAGLEGDDTLNGGGGDDTLVGGIGNDTYVVDNADDVVTELVGEGVDTVNASINWTLGANIENLTLTGSAAISATGNELNNVLTGNSGANLLDGGLGADSMAGGSGNDVYLVDDAGDVVTELSGEGLDEVQTALTGYTLADGVETLTYTGAAAFAGAGNLLDNLLTGGFGNDTLSGGDGADTLDGGAGSNLLIGGAGNDIYLVSGFGDQVVELSGEGLDEVQTALTGYTLADGVETLTYTGAAAFAGAGNLLDNLLTGGLGNDTLDGGFGADTLIGGLGDDVYVVDSIGDTVIEGANAGLDEVRTTLSAFALGDNVERLVFQGGGNASGIGNGLDNWLAGNAGDDMLDGGVGNDTLLGGLGNDVLTGGGGADLFAFALGDGQDTITDFDALQGHRIGLAAGLTYSVDTNANGDALIVYGASDIVTLIGIQPAAVTSAWFVIT